MSLRRRNDPVLSLFSFQDIITSVTGIMILVTLFLAMELILRQELTAASTKELVSQMEGSVEEAADIDEEIKENRKHIEHLREQIAAGQQKLEKAVPFDADELKSRIQDLRDRVAQGTIEVSKLSSQRSRRNSELRDIKDQVTSENITSQSVEALRREIDALEDELKRTDRNLILLKGPSDEPKKPLIVELAGTEIWLHNPQSDEAAISFSNSLELLDYLKNREPEREYVVIVLKPSGVKSYSVVYNSVGERGFDVSYQLIGESQTSIPPSKKSANK